MLLSVGMTLLALAPVRADDDEEEGEWAYCYRELDETGDAQVNPLVEVNADDGLGLQQYPENDFDDAVVLITQPENP